jgi:hypothetical protein
MLSPSMQNKNTLRGSQCLYLHNHSTYCHRSYWAHNTERAF